MLLLLRDLLRASRWPAHKFDSADGQGTCQSLDGWKARCLVYVCLPFAGDLAGNAERIRLICERLKGSCVALAPQLFLPAYFDETTERDMALQHCLRLVAACDELAVYGEPTEGMRLEMEEAGKLGIPIVFVEKGSKMGRSN